MFFYQLQYVNIGTNQNHVYETAWVRVTVRVS